MGDVFDKIDNWKHRINFFRDHKYIQNVFLKFVFVTCFLWIVLGFDSGVGIIEEGLKNLPSFWHGNITFNQWVELSYVSYGRTFHFSSFVIYGLLFYGLSRHFDTLGVVKSRNVFYAVFITLLNVSGFELIYMALFAKIQMNRNLFEWLTTDFWFLQQYLTMFLLGLGGFFAFWVESHKFKEKRRVGKKYEFRPNVELIAICYLTLFFWATWVYYPFYVPNVTIDDWSNNQLFPQTHYAYIDAELYVANDLIHTLNLIVKAMFALCLFYIVFRFRPTTKKDKASDSFSNNVTNQETL